MSSNQLPESARFVTQLAGFQRRQRAIAFFRYAPALAAVTIVLTEAVVIAFHLTRTQGVLWLAVGATLAVVSAAVVAFTRTRSLTATAFALDRRFRLDDRAVTALEFSGHSDSVSRLIVADAVARLAAHEPKELPYELLPGLRLLLASVGAISVAFAIAIGPSSLAQVRPAGRMVTAGTLKEASGATERARTPSATEAADETAAEAGTTPTPRLPLGPVGGSRQGDAAPPVRERVEASSENTNISESRTADARPVLAATAAEMPGSGLADSQRASALGQGESGGRSGMSPALGGRVDGPGGGSTAGHGEGAGGVNGSSPSHGRSRSMQKLADQSRNAAQYRRAWNQAQSAIAQERLPADRRTYVRDYFQAIRPVEEP